MSFLNKFVKRRMHSRMYLNILTTSTRKKIERVGHIATQHAEVAEIDCSLNKENDIDKDDDEKEGDEGLVVSKVLHVQILG